MKILFFSVIFLNTFCAWSVQRIFMEEDSRDSSLRRPSPLAIGKEAAELIQPQMTSSSLMPLVSSVEETEIFFNSLNQNNLREAVEATKAREKEVEAIIQNQLSEEQRFEELGLTSTKATQKAVEANINAAQQVKGILSLLGKGK